MKEDKAKQTPFTKHAQKIKYSIRIQFSVIFIGVMAGVVLMCILVNNLFLSSYYIQAKNKILKDSYENLIATASTDAYEESEFQQKMSSLTMTNNISIVIVDADSKVLYESMNGERDLEFRLLGYILGFSGEMRDTVVYESSDNYVIRRGRFATNEYLEMFGRLENGASFLMRTPVESIKESAKYANRFFIYVGLVGTFVGAWIIYFITRQITGPIMELSDISERMVELDFEARYNGDETNEIGLLGSNINKLSESLEESIRELKTANNELLRDIEKKEKIDEMRQEFLANVSHELKTPIALIQGYAEGLRDGMCEDEETRVRYSDIILDEANRMNRLVRQLLSLNEMESGGMKADKTALDLSVLIREMTVPYQGKAAETGTRLEVDVPEQLPVVSDELLLEQILQNYLSNAFHYVKDGGLVRVSAAPEEGGALISVYNEGEPIPEEALEQVWNKFYKVDKARTRAYGGSGIGLSVVKAAAELLGGRCGVENRDGGVVFTARI
jgi:signal transduction histidine kinase